jgi:hypothetical protein
MKMCISSVAPMPSIISMPVASFHSARVAAGRASPAETHFLSVRCAQPRPMCREGAIRRGRREEDGGAEFLDAGQQRVGRRLLHQHRGGPHAQRKQQQPAQAEGKGHRRAADEHVLRARPQHVGREAGADGEHVAMEVHRGLGHARGTRGEGEDAGVVGGRVDIAEDVRRTGHRGFEAVGAVVVEVADRAEARRGDACLAQLVGEAGIAQRVRDLRLLDDRNELAGAQERHRGPRRWRPAFITASQHAASNGLLGARSSTRLPGTTPISCTRTLAMRLAFSCRSA